MSILSRGQIAKLVAEKETISDELKELYTDESYENCYKKKPYHRLPSGRISATPFGGGLYYNGARLRARIAQLEQRREEINAILDDQQALQLYTQ